jgi:hypothetical protein
MPAGPLSEAHSATSRHAGPTHETAMKALGFVAYLLGPGKILFIVLILMAIAIAQRQAPSWRTPARAAVAADTTASAGREASHRLPPSR